MAWRSPRPLPVADARPEVRVDGRVFPARTSATDPNTVVADLSGYPIRDPNTLQVVAAGRRLDSSQRLRTVGAPTGHRSAERSGTLPPSDDPGLPGPHPTVRGEYTLEPLAVDGFAEPVEMQGLVIAPADVRTSSPLALFLHGRHMSCYNPQQPQDASSYLAWPCPEGWKSLPSYRGYAQSQELLASQGWITVSISANAINAQDWVDDAGAEARACLVRAHLRQWSTWAASDGAWSTAPQIVRAGPRPDLDKVLLIGHSRGGEGVNRAVLDSVTAADPWQIRGQFLIAPTAFGRNPAPGVPTVVLLPGCDGDVYDLQGQRYLDDARDVTQDPVLRSSVFVSGANHNYFNAEWTPGLAEGPADDDWYTPDDPVCGTTATPRMKADDQLTLGAVYAAAAAQVLVEGRAAVIPLFDGTPVRAESAGNAHVLSHAIGGNHTRLLIPRPTTSVTSAEGTTVRLCATTRGPDSADACAPKEAFGMTPSFGAYTGASDEPTRTALDIRWTAPDAAAAVGLADPFGKYPTRPAAVDDDATALTLRTILPAAAKGTRFTVSVRDADQHSAEVGTVSLDGIPSELPVVGHFLPSEKYWAQEVRLPLDRAALATAGVDLGSLTHLDIVPRSPGGRLWLLDVWTYRPGLSTGSVKLPRFDLGSLNLTEGREDRAVELPVTVRGTIAGSTTAWFVARSRDGSFIPLGPVTLSPGDTAFTLKIPVEGDLFDDPDTVTYSVQGLGTCGIVGGTVIGAVHVSDDDPSPPLTVTSSSQAVEGQSLTWTFTLTELSGVNLYLPVTFREPTDGSTELRTGDLSRAWLEELGYPKLPDVPLSRSGLKLFVPLLAGKTETSLVVPVVSDGLIEGTETLTGVVPADTSAKTPPWEGVVRGLPQGATLLGTVDDPPPTSGPTGTTDSTARG